MKLGNINCNLQMSCWQNETPMCLGIFVKRRSNKDATASSVEEIVAKWAKKHVKKVEGRAIFRWPAQVGFKSAVVDDGRALGTVASLDDRLIGQDGGRGRLRVASGQHPVLRHRHRRSLRRGRRALRHVPRGLGQDQDAAVVLPEDQVLRDGDDDDHHGEGGRPLPTGEGSQRHGHGRRSRPRHVLQLSGNRERNVIHLPHQPAAC